MNPSMKLIFDWTAGTPARPGTYSLSVLVSISSAERHPVRPGPLPEQIQHPLVRRAGVSVADDAAVDFHHRNQLRARATQEDLVGLDQVVDHHVLFAPGDLLLVADLHDDLARDAFQDADMGGWRAQHAVLHDPDVVRGPFGDVAGLVEHDRLVDARLDRLDLGENVVEVVEGLDLRVEAVGPVAPGRRDRAPQPLGMLLLRVELYRRGDDVDRGPGALAWIDTEVAGPPRDDQADIDIVQPASPDRLEEDLAKLFLC